MVTNTNRRTRFCIACTLNESSSHYHKQRLSYVLQLFKSLPGKAPSSAVIAFNITGFTVTNENGNSKTSSNEQDDDDYYFDPEEDEAKDRGDYSQDIKNVVQRVIFVIDDSVEPGMYRGRIYNSNGGIISSIVKGMINVAAATMNDINVNDNSNYIIDEIEDDTGRLETYKLKLNCLKRRFS